MTGDVYMVRAQTITLMEQCAARLPFMFERDDHGQSPHLLAKCILTNFCMTVDDTAAQ
eukprot:SAG31_NODE_850_length_11521_cov_47.558396_12_plen_58_part_00